MTTLGSLFDGIGGFPLAATRFGITPIWASEIEAAPVSITKRHFPEMVHLGDIRKINGAEIEPVDIITFGSPCQDLSLAGNRAGLDGERSGLFFEAIRVIEEMREKTNGAYPARIIWENVFGAYSANNGEDFRTVLEEIAQIAEPGVSIPRPPARDGWLAAGAILGDSWSLAWRSLDAQYWGVPHRRNRIFIIGDFRGQRAGEILFKPESLSGYFTESREARKRAAADIKSGIRKAIPINTQAATRCEALGERTALGIGKDGDPAFTLQEKRPHAVAAWPETVGSLVARADGSPCIDRGQPFACAAFMGGQSADARGIGYEEEVSPTLKAELGGGNQVPTVVYDARGNGDGKTVNTIVGDHQGHISDYTSLVVQEKKMAIGIDSEMNALEEKAGSMRAQESGGAEQFVAISLDCRNHTANEEVSGTLQAKENGGQSLNYINPVVTFAMQGFGDYKETDSASAIKSRDYKDNTDLTLGHDYIVRRLTPTECERLQGFPDGWTEYGVDPKKYEKSLKRGMKRTGPGQDAPLCKISDSARYKALGNSLAEPCIEYIMSGLAEPEVWE